MSKHTKPRPVKPGSLTHKLFQLAVGESLLCEVADQKAFNRKRDHAKLSLKVPVMMGMNFDYDLLFCSNLSKPDTNCLIMRITRLIDTPAMPEE